MDEPQEARSAIVVGGGVIGAACALRLQQSGIACTLVDEARATPPASWGNAGHIATEQTRPLASGAVIRAIPKRLFWFGGPVDLCWRDAATWLPWMARYVRASAPARYRHGHLALSRLLQEAMPAWRRLAADLGQPDLLIESGHLVLWESTTSVMRGHAEWQDPGAAQCRAIDEPRLSELRARFAVPLAGGLAFTGTGQVRDPALVLAALHQAFRDNGGAPRNDIVTALVPDQFRPGVVLASGEQLKADIVVVCAGANAKALMAGVGAPAPLIAERGYHVEAPLDGDWPLPPTVFEDRSTIVTRFGGRLRISSFVEFGRPATAPDPRKWHHLEQHIRALGLPMKGPFARWMGARPTLPDYLPAIGTVRPANNIAYAFGHQHLGLTLAPITAEIVADLVRGRPPALDPAPFDLARFAPAAQRAGEPAAFTPLLRRS